MNDPHDTLPDDIQALLRAERGGLNAPPAGQARLAERLAASVPGFGAPAVLTHAPLAAHTKAAAAPWLTKMLLAVAVSGSAAMLVATGIHATRGTARTEPTLLTRVPTMRVAEPASPAPTIETPAFDEPPPLVTPPTPRKTVGPQRSSGAALSTEASLAEENRLLDAARTALNRGDAVTALALTSEHSRKMPHGALTEENYALRISALVKLGQKTEAEAALATMRAEYPTSFLLQRATNDVASIP